MQSFYEELNHKTILLTGATGLLGKTLVRRIRMLAPKAVLAALVRDRNRAERILGAETQFLHYIIGDVTDQNLNLPDCDYIIHAASQTSSRAFIQEPVETVMTAFLGTKNLLETGRKKKVRSFLYLSSMEVYGAPSTDEKITEIHGTDLDPMKVRSCYPESKRMCESLCASYASEYGVPAKVLRLTQTFGPGVEYEDGRVFAEFARCVLEKRNIVLKTKGETCRNYLYTEDAADAIVTVLLRGETGQAYNAANEDTYCSIYDMACMTAAECANGAIQVVVEDSGTAESLGYAPVLHMNLDTAKIRALGWKPATGLKDMFDLMIRDMEESRSHQNLK